MISAGIQYMFMKFFMNLLQFKMTSEFSSPCRHKRKIIWGYCANSQALGRKESFSTFVSIKTQYLLMFHINQKCSGVQHELEWLGECQSCICLKG
jgi:hypothetical protein